METGRGSCSRIARAVAGVRALVAAAGVLASVVVAGYGYDTTVAAIERARATSAVSPSHQAIFFRLLPSEAIAGEYDYPTNFARTSARSHGYGSAPQTAGGGGRVFTDFTDEAGAAGITGTRPLAVGQSAEVRQLTFAKGNNPFLVGEGRIGVTDLGLDATPGQLNGIDVFGARQQYGIQFSELDAWNSGVRVMGDLPSRNIYSIPGGCTITGTCTVTRLR